MTNRNFGFRISDFGFALEPWAATGVGRKFGISITPHPDVDLNGPTKNSKFEIRNSKSLLSTLAVQWRWAN